MFSRALKICDPALCLFLCSFGIKASLNLFYLYRKYVWAAFTWAHLQLWANYHLYLLCSKACSLAKLFTGVITFDICSTTQRCTTLLVTRFLIPYSLDCSMHDRHCQRERYWQWYTTVGRCGSQRQSMMSLARLLCIENVSNRARLERRDWTKWWWFTCYEMIHRPLFLFLFLFCFL